MTNQPVPNPAPEPDEPSPPPSGLGRQTFPGPQDLMQPGSTAVQRGRLKRRPVTTPPEKPTLGGGVQQPTGSIPPQAPPAPSPPQYQPPPEPDPVAPPPESEAVIAGLQSEDRDKDPDLETRFSYHPPDEDVILKLKEVRTIAKAFAYKLKFECPRSRELSLALTHLEQVVMFANASLVRPQAKRK